MPNLIQISRVILPQPAFSPASLLPYGWWETSNLVSQFEDDSATDPAEVDDAIAVFRDLSGNSFHGAQTTSGNRPILRLSTYYYHEHDGTNDCLPMSSANDILRNRAGFTYVGAAQFTATGSAIKTLASFTTGSGGGRLGVQSTTSSTFLQIAVRRLDADSSTTASVAITAGVTYVITVHVDYAGTGGISVAVNRGTPGTNTLPGGAANSSNTAASGGNGFGGFGGTTANPLNGRHYCSVLTPLLSAGDTADLEDYVAARAGVSL